MSTSIDTQPPAGGNRKSAPTIYDIATAAGVSPSTVSRALNRPGRIKKETEQRIRDEAERLGYRINPIARALHTGRTGNLGLILTDISNPIFFDVMRGSEAAAAAAGQTLVISVAHGTQETEFEAARRLLSATDGLLLASSRLSNEEIQRLAAEKPIVMANRTMPQVPGLLPDFEPGLIEALDHLQALGHTSVGFVSGTNADWNLFRWQTLFPHAVERGMNIVEIPGGIPTRQGGHDIFARTLATGVTAVIAYNDLMAIGLLEAARAAGVSIPGRLSVVGFDDIFGADLTTPSLTTIHNPFDDVGAASVRGLVALINDEPFPDAEPLETSLIVRESTGPVETV